MRVKRHWPFAILAAAALALLLINLGGEYFWEDEGDTAVFASNVLKFGVPTAWDGVTFSDSDRGDRIDSNLLMVSIPWLQYYVVAGSFRVFGENTFAGRLPFALAGWVTVLAVYAIVWSITKNRWSAFAAATVLILSVQFLLYSRQCRYYSVSMLLSCALFWLFLRLQSWSRAVLFALTAILLFYTHPLGVVPLAGMAALTLFYRPLKLNRRYFWSAVPVILLFIVPWIVLSRSGYAAVAEPVPSIGDFGMRAAQYLIECASAAPLVGCLCLWVFGTLRWRGFLKSKEKALFVLVAATLVANTVAISTVEPSTSLWITGIRYTAAVLPLLAMLAGILVTKVARRKTVVWLSLLLIFGFTNFARLSLWFGQKRMPREGQIEFVGIHAPERLVDSIFSTGLFYFVRDLWTPNPGTVAQTCKLLSNVVRPGEMFITNYEWEAFYFHTRLPQAWRILPHFRIAALARKKGLPDHVFSVDHVRWIVWRLTWENFYGYRWDDVEKSVIASGGQLTQIAELTDTIWENRENIHYHRFSGGRYLYPMPGRRLPVGIFRVDWPQEMKPAH